MAEFVAEPQSTTIIEGGNDYIMFSNDAITLDNSGSTAALTGSSAEFFRFSPALDSLTFTDTSTVNESSLNKTATFTGSFRVNHLKKSSHDNLQHLQDNVNLECIVKPNNGIFYHHDRIVITNIIALSEADPAGRQDYEVQFNGRGTRLGEILAGISTLTQLEAASTSITYTSA